MTTSTLITAFGAGLVLVGSAVVFLVGLAVLWFGRKVGDALALQGEIDTLRTELKNLDDFLEVYRKRDAQRVSTAVQRAKKNGKAPAPADEEQDPFSELSDDVRGLFHRYPTDDTR